MTLYPPTSGSLSWDGSASSTAAAMAMSAHNHTEYEGHITLERASFPISCVDPKMAWRSSPLVPSDSGEVFLPALIALLATYHLLAPCYPSRKQRAWILTTVTSGLMTLSCVPFLLDFVRGRGDVWAVRQGGEWAWTACRVFQAYLLADLSMGVAYYPEHVNILSGWFHHSLYILLVDVAIRYNMTHVFCLCFIMEVRPFFPELKRGKSESK